MKAILTLLLGLVLGLFGGWMLVQSTQSGPHSGADLAPREATPNEAPRDAPTLTPSAVTPGWTEGRGLRQDVEQELFSEPLLEHHDREFRRGWRSVRKTEPNGEAQRRGEERFRAYVLARSARLGEAMAEDANDLDRTRIGLTEYRGLELLELLAGDTWAPGETDLAGELLDRCVVASSAGPVIDGTSFAEDREAFVKAGTTISFGPGIHVLDERRLRGEDRRTLPPDVTIVGAGKDATLLRLGDISINGDVEHLTFRDLTVDAENDGMFDLRTGNCLLDFLRVRVVRFDAGHGGCSIFFVSKGTMLRAEECDFIGGYGRSPGNGDLLRGDVVVARFSRCRFELIELRGLGRSGHHLLFDRCRFLLEDTNPLGLKLNGLYLRGCTVEQIPPDTPSGELRKELGDLFYGA